MTWQYDLQRRANLIFAQMKSVDFTSIQLRDMFPTDTDVAARKAGIGSCPDTHLDDEQATGLTISVAVRMRQVPTSFVHLLEPDIAPLVTFRITNHDAGRARVKLVSRVEGFSSDAIETIAVPARHTIERSHLPVFLLDRIASVTEARAASLYVRIDDLDTEKTQHEESYRIVLLPRTTAYLSVEDETGGVIDLSRYLGAWVTPNAPEVMQVIREAAALHPSGTIVGYQPPHSDDLPRIVATQVEAIYKALQARKLTYVASVTAYCPAGAAFVQRIRLPRESLATRSANCIDGVVLMASVLEAASLNPAIVLVPGHAFVAYELVQHSGNWDYVETAMIGSAPFHDARAAARRTAKGFTDRGSVSMRLLEMRKLRTEYSIYPME